MNILTFLKMQMWTLSLSALEIQRSSKLLKYRAWESWFNQTILCIIFHSTYLNIHIHLNAWWVFIDVKSSYVVNSESGVLTTQPYQLKQLILAFNLSSFFTYSLWNDKSSQKMMQNYALHLLLLIIILLLLTK